MMLPISIMPSQYYFYLFPPVFPQCTNPDDTLKPTSPHQHEITQQLENNFQEEKIYVTRQDLQRQGYLQTKKPWTQQEDRLLLKLCRKQDFRFDEIARHIDGRNAKMCYSRYRRLSYHTKISWTKLSDEKLSSLVRQFGEDNWKHISTFFQGRTPKQIKDHYYNYLKDDLNRNDWTLEEDVELIRRLNTHGKNWKLIQEGLPGRSRNQIKNRFFGKITRLNNKKIAQMRESLQVI